MMELNDLITILENKIQQEQNAPYDAFTLTCLYELRARRKSALEGVKRAIQNFDMERDFYE